MIQEQLLFEVETSRYSDSLTIQSEEDLMTLNTSGQTVYEPFDQEHYASLAGHIKQTKVELRYAIDSIKWAVDNDLYWADRVYYILNNIIIHLDLVLKKIRHSHRCLHHTIWGDWDSQILQLYDQELLQLFSDFNNQQKRLEQNALYERLSLYPCKDARYDFYAFYKRVVEEREGLVPDKFDFDHARDDYFKEIFIATFQKVQNLVDCLDNALIDLGHFNLSRQNSELVIIFEYIKKQYINEQTAKMHDKEKEQHPFYRRYKQYFQDRYKKETCTAINELLDRTESKYENFQIVKVWNDNKLDADDSTEGKEKLLYEIVRLRPSKEQFDTLFEYLMKYEYINLQLKERHLYEIGADPMFDADVDIDKLQDYLGPWLRGNLQYQYQWSIVMCIMKYSVNILKEDVKPKSFCNRMNSLFNCDTKCTHESLRRMTANDPRNTHISHWNKKDPYYSFGDKLYQKLNDKEKYRRD